MYQPKRREDPTKKTIHPVWRGIGCVLLVVIPVISYVAADFFVTNQARFSWVAIPQEMVVKNLTDSMLIVKIFYTAIFVFFLYLILTVATFIINRIFGPSRYGPYDIPLDKVQRK
jgi:hypothetical protein